jgi:hypothetical protein
LSGFGGVLLACGLDRFALSFSTPSARGQSLRVRDFGFRWRVALAHFSWILFRQEGKKQALDGTAVTSRVEPCSDRRSYDKFHIDCKTPNCSNGYNTTLQLKVAACVSPSNQLLNK